jgi:hypothetical protein
VKSEGNLSTVANSHSLGSDGETNTQQNHENIEKNHDTGKSEGPES